MTFNTDISGKKQLILCPLYLFSKNKSWTFSFLDVGVEWPTEDVINIPPILFIRKLFCPQDQLLWPLTLVS